MVKYAKSEFALSTGHGIHGPDGAEHAERHAEERRGVQRPALHDGESEGGIWNNQS